MACRCFQCQHFDHEVVDCPFSPRGSTGEGSSIKESCTRPARAGGNQHRHLQQHPAHQRHQSSSLPSIYHQGRENLHQVSNQTPAIFPTEEGPTCAGTVSRSTQVQSVILQAQLPLNLDGFQHCLACHPDRQWSQSPLQAICEGVDIGYQGERKTVWSGNWKSAMDNGSMVSEYLTAEVALVRKAGPFNQPPFLTYASGHQWA